jgi:hypothetical protein
VFALNAGFDLLISTKPFPSFQTAISDPMFSFIVAFGIALLGTFAEWQKPFDTLSAPIIDLGYASYQGTYNPATNVSSYQSIRFAAPPTGKFHVPRRLYIS